MNSLQDHPFFILVAYGVSALLVVGELALLWRRRRRVRDVQDAQHTGEEHP